MAVASCASIEISKQVPQLLSPRSGKWDNCRLTVHSWKSLYVGGSICKQYNIRITKCAKLDSNSMAATNGESKTVWIWTENKQVMTAAVERGWNTFIFPSHCGELAKDWASIAFINPLFVKEKELIDIENKRVATFFEISSPEQLDQLLLIDDMLENVIVDLLDWQVIPAENMVAAFQGSMKKLFAIAKNPEEAQISLEALEHGLDGVVLRLRMLLLSSS
ncbi:hypothetical protein Nepgr_006974 [Nepenthes gracilis]|uniref:3-dehydroquinate synthase N-terminal domain-containing protein n=1 Tax=Nepenthes gracilis TaxID=150966 RepID=A0AAD3S678_NEPGR|nr:hypothetical protein Nepgr_006974 [Nepenthes gracilis]